MIDSKKRSPPVVWAGDSLWPRAERSGALGKHTTQIPSPPAFRAGDSRPDPAVARPKNGRAQLPDISHPRAPLRSALGYRLSPAQTTGGLMNRATRDSNMIL